MSATGSQTVLIFKEIQFLGDWTRSNGASAILYLANKPAKLVALVEDHAGNNITYYFSLPARAEVWICYGGDAQAHIPAICVRGVPGDQIKCAG